MNEKLENKVSVIIPAYNAEKYIERSVKSVLSQTYTNLEIILVDDGATDSTGMICDELASKDSKIKVFHKKNGGMSDARNFGINEASGDYICFLDADDTYHDTFVEKLLQEIISYNADIAVSGYVSCYEDGRKTDSDVFDVITCLDRQQAERELIKGRYLSSHAWNKMYKRDIWSKVKFPLGKNYEDAYIMPYILHETQRIVFVNECLLDYMQVEGSITHQKKLRIELDALWATISRFDLYKNEYSDLWAYLVKEPIGIAIRNKFIKPENDADRDKMVQYREMTAKFIGEVRYKKESYKMLNTKYKLCLALYPLIRSAR